MRRSSIIAAGLLVAGLCIGHVATASAYGLTGVGMKLGFLDPENRDGTTSVDVNLEFEEAGSHLHLVPGFMYWKSDGLSDKNPNFDLYYHWLSNREVSPFFGAGLGLHSYDSDRGGGHTDPGANLFAGIRFPGRTANLYLEGRYVITDLAQTMIRGGVTFNLDQFRR